jgi:ribosomal protein S18 acetylase RimI-like enzyme
MPSSSQATTLTVRPARRDDLDGARLLYVSAEPYYDAYAGSGRRARKLLRHLWSSPGHTASYEQCRVAVRDDAVVGVLAVFRTEDGDRLARRFLAQSFVRIPFWRWPFVIRHLHASASVIPLPPGKSLYVDALAVDEAARRSGVATALLDEAVRMATDRGLAGVSLDTGLQNSGAQALYEAYGFRREGIRRAPSDKIARAVGGPGFVSYFKAVSAP